MTVEDDAKEIERLALMPVCRLPHAGHCLYVNIVFVQHDFQAYAVMLRRREEVIVDLETRLFFDTAIGAANVCQKVELCLRRRLQELTRGDDVFAWHDHGRLAQGGDHFGDPLRMLTL